MNADRTFCSVPSGATPFQVHPFQKLCYVSGTSETQPLLLAAAGPSIVSFDPIKGEILSQIPPFEDEGSEEDGAEPAAVEVPSLTKRRKLEHPNVSSVSRGESEESVEIVAERRKGERRRPKVEGSKLPNVSHLLATSDGRKVIAVTTEDKSIRVFSRKNQGKLILNTCRSMPKRLCAITLTPDETTIIAADKFGDVYSLPLVPSDKYVAPTPSPTPMNGTFEPSATEGTVHTKGNLEALRQQRDQKKVNPRKEGPDFEHKLLLGHVSLLTDLAIARAEVASKQRHFILTSDRDEHVRVSRYPQAHVIHGYCLGFREFVSKIRTVPWAQQFLIVGSGEPALKVFDWRRGRLISQFLFDGHVQEKIRNTIANADSERSPDRLAVSGIWPISAKAAGGHASQEETSGVFLVALEGLPLLFSFHIDSGGKLQHDEIIPLSGNVLDITVDIEKGIRAIVSLDHFRGPGSMIIERAGNVAESDIIITLEFDRGLQSWSRCQQGFGLKDTSIDGLRDVPQAPHGRPVGSSRARGEYSTVGEFLYGLENLRKKRGFHAEDADESLAATEDMVAADEGD